MVQKRKAGAWRYKQGSKLQKELKLGDIPEIPYTDMPIKPSTSQMKEHT
jgi:hypothetical protein